LVRVAEAPTFVKNAGRRAMPADGLRLNRTPNRACIRRENTIRSVSYFNKTTLGSQEARHRAGNREHAMTAQDGADRRAAGERVRREVLGEAYVDRGRLNADPFYQHFLDFTVEHCWGNVWVRSGLDRKIRSMLNLAMLASLGRWHEFEVHTRGAINNGVTESEIAEVLLQAGVYAGVPVAAEGFRRAQQVIKDLRAS
jgi:4-carboxymuconolactone decarboxylase